MKYTSRSLVWAVAILLFLMGEASIAATYMCSDPQGNEVYTDHRGPGCREFTPTPPNDIEGKPTAKTPQAPKRKSSDAIPSGPLPRSSGEQKSGAVVEPPRNGLSYSEQDLLRAVASGNKEKTERVLRAGVSANAKDEQRQSALTMAAGLPSADIARLLIAHGADVNSRSSDGTTPLMAAMMAGQKETARLFLRYGADVNASAKAGSPTSQNMPLLYLAIAIGDVEMAKLLIEGGADLNATLSDDAQMLSPLTFAMKTKQQDIARLLMATKQSAGPLQTHIRQLEDRLTSLCKGAGENIYDYADNVEGVYVHVREQSAGKAFGYYHEKDRLSSTYLSPA
jgi:hypothetical protein